MRALRFLVFIWFATTLLFGQTTARTQNVPLWSPPAFYSPRVFPKGTVPKVMVSGIKIGAEDVVLEKSNLDSARKQFGGAVGSSGDAGDYLAWVCLAGEDDGGRWILWLMSGEVDGPSVGGFQLRRLEGEKVDSRCHGVHRETNVEVFPTKLRLGMSEQELLRTIGPPTLKRGNMLWFEHEHEVKITSEPYTVTNSVSVQLQRGVVTAFQVWKSTLN